MFHFNNKYEEPDHKPGSSPGPRYKSGRLKNSFFSKAAEAIEQSVFFESGIVPDDKHSQKETQDKELAPAYPKMSPQS